MPIETAYHPLGSNGKMTLLEVELITGRTHQIRAHLSSIGHPLLGDSLYHLSDTTNLFSRAALPAWKLKFHPPFPAGETTSGILSSIPCTENAKKEISLEAPLPEDFKKFYETMF